MSKHFSSLLFLLTTIIWGLAFAFQKDAAVIPAFTVSAIRGLMAALMLFLIIPVVDRITQNNRRLFSRERLLDFSRDELVGGVICGIFITVATAMQQGGLGAGTDAGKAAFITVLYVVIVPVIALFFGKKPSKNLVVSIIIAVIGFYFLCISPEAVVELSDLLVLGCAVVFSLHIIVIDRFSPKCDGIRLSFVQFFVCFVISSICALIFERPIDFDLIGSKMTSLLYVGLCSGGIGYTLQIIGQKNADPTVASLIFSLEAVFGVVGAAVLLGETMSTREYAGCAIVFVAILLAQFDPVSLIKSRLKGNNDTENCESE